MRILLVGGAVRNLLLGKPVADKDYLVLDADEAELLRAFPEARKAGREFTAYLVGNNEYSLPRPGPAPVGATAPAPSEASKKGLVDTTDANQDDPLDHILDADLMGRDLTINAMALEAPLPGQPVTPGLMLLHPQALPDLMQGVLRPASSSAMNDDPARVFRAARFYAQLPDFTPHKELVTAMRRCARRGLLDGLPPERVGRELRKALTAPRPGNFLRLLDAANCLRPWFRELAGASRVPAGPLPYHDTDVLSHTAQVMDRLALEQQARAAGGPSLWDEESAALAVWMGLTHDLGKSITDQAIWPHHYEHEHHGEPLARNLGERLRLPVKFIRAGAEAAKLHMKAGHYAILRPGTRVDLLERLHRADLMDQMFALARADSSEDQDNAEALAKADLTRMLGVRLDPEDQDLGSASGERLRNLRCQALANAADD